jgi:hypothetical protein
LREKFGPKIAAAGKALKKAFKGSPPKYRRRMYFRDERNGYRHLPSGAVYAMLKGGWQLVVPSNGNALRKRNPAYTAPVGA